MYLMTEEQIRKELKKRLSKKRYIHSLAVADSARELADLYGYDSEKATFAGLVHDVCKDDTREKQLQMAEEFGIILTESERACPKLWHAILGAAYTARFFTDDSDIIAAVRYHTTARRDMSLLEKIIYVADCISADRSYPTVDKLRTLARKSLDGVIYQMVRITLSELAEAGYPLHEDTVNAYNQICLDQAGNRK